MSHLPYRLLTLIASFILAFNSYGTTSQDIGEELPFPTWDDKDKEANMKGTWWEKTAILLPEKPNNAEDETPEPIIMAGNDIMAVNPIPEDLDKVNPHFLPGYIRPVNGLSDPQSLLDEVQSNDIIEMIKLVKEKYGISLYVSIFAKNQDMPPSINAPALARQIFQNGETSALLHIHLDNINATQLALDPQLNSALGIDGSYKLLYTLKQKASRYDNPSDQILESLANLGTYIAEQLPQHQGNQQGVQIHQDIHEIDGVPQVGIVLEEKEKKEEKSIKELIFEAKDQLWLYRFPLIGLGATLIFAILFWIYWRRFHVVRLLRSEPDIRLGAPHGASQSRLFNYCQQDGKQPESVGRTQIREHIRDSA